MFSFEELCQLVRVVAETRVGAIEIERDGMRVRIDGIPTPTTTVAAGATLLPPHVVAGGAPFAGATQGLLDRRQCSRTRTACRSSHRRS
jgi:hypothetical protein